MKKIILTVACAALGAGTILAQDLTEAQVPSVVLNSFKKEFPKASDVEWEQKSDTYKVEFEIGTADHDAWYDATGQLVKHKEDIGQNDLPTSITNVIAKEYSAYRASDIEKTQSGGKTTYQLDFKSPTEKWEVTFDENGKVLKKKAE